MKVEKFDIGFQKEVLSLAINNQSFASKLHSLIYKRRKLGSKGRWGKSETLEVGLFSAPQLNLIAKSLFSSLEKNDNVLPSKSSIRNEIKKSSGDQGEELCKLFDQVSSIEVGKSSYHKHELVKFIKAVRIIELRNYVDQTISKGFESLVNITEEVEMEALDISKITFDASSVITFENPLELVSLSAKASGEAIKIGIAPFDNIASNGLGFTKQNTLLIFGGSNDGKSMVVSVEITVNIAKQGKRVLVVNLEGETYLLPIRIISCYTGIPLNKLDRYYDVVKGDVSSEKFKEFFSEEEYELLKDANKILENIRILHTSSSKDARYIEFIISQAKEIYEEWPYEVIVSDYAGLAQSKKSMNSVVEENSFCFREFDGLAGTLNLLHIAVAQANREGIKDQKSVSERQKDLPILREYHLAGAISWYHDAAFAISISATPDEKIMGIRRLTMLKNRKGATGVTIAIKGDWASARPLTGNIEIITGDYNDGGASAFSSKKKTNALGLVEDNAPKKSAREIFSILDMDLISREMAPIIRHRKLEMDMKSIKMQKKNLEDNGGNAEEDQEKFSLYEQQIDNIANEMSDIFPSDELVSYYNDKLLPLKNDLREVLKSNSKDIKNNKEALQVVAFIESAYSPGSLLDMYSRKKAA